MILPSTGGLSVRSVLITLTLPRRPFPPVTLVLREEGSGIDSLRCPPLGAHAVWRVIRFRPTLAYPASGSTEYSLDHETTMVAAITMSGSYLRSSLLHLLEIDLVVR